MQVSGKRRKRHMQRTLPALGTYREIKYLYVGTGGSLYQPEDRGARTDVTDADCDAEKLKHKATARVG